MKILVLTQYFYPHTGGSQEYILELYKEVIKQDPATSVDVVCYNTDGAALEESIGGLTIYRIPCLELLPGQFSLPNPVALFKVFQKLKQKNGSYDIVNSHTRFFDNSWYAPLVAKYFSAKSVLTDHCASHPVHQNILVNGFVQMLDAVLAKIIPMIYNSVTSVSQATSDFLIISGYKHFIPVFYSGVNEAFLKNSHSKLPISIPAGKTVISFVGRMIASKNPELALQVAETISKKYPHVLFVFAGDGPALARLKRSTTKHIQFVGKLNRAQTAALLQKTDILLHPSVHHEGLPITLLEAGFSKVAVIASNAGATSEVVTNNHSGLIVTPTVTDMIAATEKLIANIKLRKQLGEKLYRHVSSHFHWSQTAKKYRAFLHSIIAQ